MKLNKQLLYFASIFVLMLSTISCTDDTKEVVKLSSIVEIAKADPANFSILVDALKKTSLDVTLSNPGSYTVFAPTNAAFSAAGYSSAAINALDPLVPADAIKIADLKLRLQNHVIGIGTRADDLIAGGYFKTFGFLKTSATSTSGANLSIFINKSAADVVINGGASNGGAKVTKADIDASNGILHVIDAVMTLPTIVNQIAANPSLTTLLNTVKSTPQATVLTTLNAATGSSPVSVYAPNNDAFTAALGTGGYLVGKTDADITKILNYHFERSNRVASSTTAFSTSADVTVTTLFTPNTLVLTRSTLKIVDKSNPAVNGNAKVLNIQGTNGSVQIIDKVLQSL